MDTSSEWFALTEKWSVILTGKAGRLIGAVLLALFAILSSAQAATVESVAPVSDGGIWLFYDPDHWSPPTSSPDVACNSGWNAQWSMASHGYAYVGSVPNQHGYANLGYRDCIYRHIETGQISSGGGSIRRIPYPPNCPIPAVNRADQYVYNVLNNMCERPVQETYTLSLAPETAAIEPGKTYSFTATVTKQDGGTLSQPVPVSVKVEVDPTSGGHVHGDASRPKGSVSPASGSTMLYFTFTAEASSGKHTITATCNLCVNKNVTATVNVKVPDLTILTPSPDYVLVGGETGKKHTDNHYLTTTAKENLKKIVKEYSAAYPAGPLLRLNDASLIWGGKFDIAGNWGGEHKEHRRGDVIDIRANQDATAIPESRFKDFESFAAGSGAFADLHCNPPYSRTCPGCILDTGSNRHFHVYLLGQ